MGGLLAILVYTHPFCPFTHYTHPLPLSPPSPHITLSPTHVPIQFTPAKQPPLGRGRLLEARRHGPRAQGGRQHAVAGGGRCAVPRPVRFVIDDREGCDVIWQRVEEAVAYTRVCMYEARSPQRPHPHTQSHTIRELLARAHAPGGITKPLLLAADVFSLGASVFEAATGVRLKDSGPDWHALRDGGKAVEVGGFVGL